MLKPYGDFDMNQALARGQEMLDNLNTNSFKLTIPSVMPLFPTTERLVFPNGDIVEMIRKGNSYRNSDDSDSGLYVDLFGKILTGDNCYTGIKREEE